MHTLGRHSLELSRYMPFKLTLAGPRASDKGYGFLALIIRMTTLIGFCYLFKLFRARI